MRLILLLTLIVVTTTAVAQKKTYFDVGYIIRPDSSLRAGYVQVLDSLPSNACWFKDAIDAAPERYDPTQILGYGFFRGKAFFSFRTQDRVPLFFERLVNGEVKVFKALNVYLIQRGKNRPVQLNRRTFESTLAELLPDCPFVTKKLRQAKLESKSLTWIVRQYNECVKGDPKEFRGTEYVKINVGVLSTLANSVTTLSSNADYPQLTGSASNLKPLSAGVQLWFSYPNLSERIILRTGAAYGQQSMSMVRPVAGGGSSKANIAYTEIQFPVTLQLLMGAKKNLFARAGTSIMLVNNVTSHMETDAITPAGVFIDESVPIASIKKNPQFLIGLGVTYSLSKKYKMMLEGTYSGGSGYLTSEGGTSNLRADFQCFGVSAGLILK